MKNVSLPAPGSPLSQAFTVYLKPGFWFTLASPLNVPQLPENVTEGTLVFALCTSMLPPVAPSSWYESDALGLSFWATNPKLAVRPGVWEAIWPPPVIFSAPGGGGGGWLAQEPVVTTKPAVAMSWCVKSARISRREVGLSGRWSGPTPVFTL